MEPFDLQPVLTGDLVVLRPLRPEDFAPRYAVAADPLVWAQHPESNRYEEPVFRKFFRVAMAFGGAFAVIDRADGCAIGSSRFHGYVPTQREVEIRWTFLARNGAAGTTAR